MQGPISHDAIVVSDTSFHNDDPREIVESNISFVNALREEYLTLEEISTDALRSYYVDYYLCQVNNGGFSQFVYNSHWGKRVTTFIRDGMRAMQARQHLEVFEEGAQLVEEFGSERLRAYCTSEYFGENPERDELNVLNDRFLETQKQEDLLALNIAWLRQHPKLVVLTVEQIREEVRRRGQALADREKRIAEARAGEPDGIKRIRALCERAGQELKRVTAGDPNYFYEGVLTMAWYFITDQGPHRMVEVGGKAIMFRGHSITDRVCEIDVPER
jgi:hypothetical protein